jgi:uncharacterized protein YabN with tetrapyrrole methylase and pyrophosphatase domain
MKLSEFKREVFRATTKGSFVINNDLFTSPRHETRIETLIWLIKQWHRNRGLIDNSTDLAQFAKLVQEVGELSDNICKGKDLRDDIGDIMVVLINIAERNNISILECLETAYNDIKDRKGFMSPEGVFIKEEDK